MSHLGKGYPVLELLLRTGDIEIGTLTGYYAARFEQCERRTVGFGRIGENGMYNICLNPQLAESDLELFTPIPIHASKAHAFARVYSNVVFNLLPRVIEGASYCKIDSKLYWSLGFPPNDPFGRGTLLVSPPDNKSWADVLEWAVDGYADAMHRVKRHEDGLAFNSYRAFEEQLRKARG